MGDSDSGDDQRATGTAAEYDSFALAVQHAYEQTRMHSLQAVPEVEERLRGKLRSQTSR